MELSLKSLRHHQPRVDGVLGIAVATRWSQITTTSVPAGKRRVDPVRSAALRRASRRSTTAPAWVELGRRAGDEHGERTTIQRRPSVRARCRIQAYPQPIANAATTIETPIPRSAERPMAAARRLKPAVIRRVGESGSDMTKRRKWREPRPTPTPRPRKPLLDPERQPDEEKRHDVEQVALVEVLGAVDVDPCADEGDRHEHDHQRRKRESGEQPDALRAAREA